MDPKRKASRGIDKYGGNAAKKRVGEGPDIPSSNFAAPKEKKAYKNAVTTSNMVTSLPSTQVKVQTVSKVLHNLQLPEKYREVVGPDVERLLKYQKEKEKKQAIEQKRKEKERLLAPPKPKEEEKIVEEDRPKQIVQDESGRIRDEKGNIINLKPSNASSLKINLNKAKEERVKELLRFQRASAMTATRTSKIFDPELVSRSKSLREKKKNNAFHFIEKGSIVQKAEALRSNTTIEPEKDGQEAEKSTLISEIKDETTMQNIPAGLNRISVRVKRHDPIPDTEWWDIPLLPANKKTYLPFEDPKEEVKPLEDGNTEENFAVEKYKKNLESLLNLELQEFEFRREKINHMIEHPAAFKLASSNQNVTIPVYLTKEERKKLRRRKRLEREKEKQEKIKLGLIKPPPPKVKFSNFMNVMKDEAVADPTKVEMEVKKAIQDRLQAHLERNAKRKLTKEQKAEKAMRKLKRDSALECRVAVFRIDELTNGAHRFKVNMNAQQMALNGSCIIPDKKFGLNLPAVVVVEGGPKAIKFYKKLMLKRIKWNTNPKKADDVTKDGEANETTEENTVNNNNKCKLVWEGVVKDRHFHRWRVIDIKNELEGRRLLGDRGLEHFWDYALGLATATFEEDEE